MKLGVKLEVVNWPFSDVSNLDNGSSNMVHVIHDRLNLM